MNGPNSPDQAPESRPGRINSLDGIRALAVFMVIGNHAFSGEGVPESIRVFGQELFGARLGVRTFLVMGGFLITYLLAKEKAKHGRVSVRNFFARSAIRIYPVLFVYVAFLASLEIVTHLDLDPWQYLSSLTLTKNYLWMTPVDGHLWSISCQEQFYLIWVVVFACLSLRSALIFLSLSILVAPVIRIVFYKLGYSLLLQLSLPTNIDCIAIGCLGGLLLYHREQLVTKCVSRYVVLGRLLMVAVIIAAHCSQASFTWARFAIPLRLTIQSLAILYLIYSFALVPRGPIYWMLNARPMVFVGKASYSIYIWHQVFFCKFVDFGVSYAFVLTFPQNIYLSLIAGLLSYRFIEYPLLQLKNLFRPNSVREAKESFRLQLG